jgi:hypothetical protein
MNRIYKVLLGVFVLAASITAPISSASASSSPRLNVEPMSNSQFKINISSASTFSQVDLYMHQSDSELWNAILNIGTTDRNGRFTTTRTLRSFHPELDWTWYAQVDGWNTPTTTTKSRTSNTGQVRSNTTYANGALVADNGTVYIIYRDQKIGFSSGYAFTRMGFDWSDVITGNTSSLPLIYVINESSTSHPWGSWIKLGSKTYFVHEKGLIPVTTQSLLRSNGGQTNLVVSGNRYDEKLKKLSSLKKNDSRLK